MRLTAELCVTERLSLQGVNTVADKYSAKSAKSTKRASLPAASAAQSKRARDSSTPPGKVRSSAYSPSAQA